MSIDWGTVCYAIGFIVVIIVLALILQYLFNPKKNSMWRKYIELENEKRETVEKKELTEEEKKFYEEIWNKKKS